MEYSRWRFREDGELPPADGTGVGPRAMPEGGRGRTRASAAGDRDRPGRRESLGVPLSSGPAGRATALLRRIFQASIVQDRTARSRALSDPGRQSGTRLGQLLRPAPRKGVSGFRLSFRRLAPRGQALGASARTEAGAEARGRRLDYRRTSRGSAAHRQTICEGAPSPPSLGVATACFWTTVPPPILEPPALVLYGCRTPAGRS